MKAMDFSAQNLELNGPKMFCIIDGNRGIYIPQQFAKHWGNSVQSGITGGQMRILLSGPQTSGYWDVWEEVVNEVQFLFDGQLCTLYESGDLWAVPVN